MFSDNIFKNKYLKYKTKYINLQKGGSAAAAADDKQSPDLAPDLAPGLAPGFGALAPGFAPGFGALAPGLAPGFGALAPGFAPGFGALAPGFAPGFFAPGFGALAPDLAPGFAASAPESVFKLTLLEPRYNITNYELNEIYQSIGFEFEYSGLFINTPTKELFDALTKSHNKLKIKLPAVYENIELEIGNDGPYKYDDSGNEYYNFEINVTFKDKQKCANIYMCYITALHICNRFIHDSFYKYEKEDSSIEHQPKKPRSKPTIEYKHKTSELYIIPNKAPASPPYESINLCLSQCTFGVLYNDIKNFFSIILGDMQHCRIQFDLNQNELLFKKIFEGDLVKLKNKEQTSEIKKQIIKIENWIFLISYYYTCIHQFYHLKLLKTSMPFLLRHGLINIMPPELKETMRKIELMENDANNYLYYLYKFNEYPNSEKSITVRLNKKKQLIYEPHESNYFDFRDDILYVEYRDFIYDEILKKEPRHFHTCYDYLDLSNLATTNDENTTFIIDEPNKQKVISKIGELELNSIFEKYIHYINSKLITKKMALVVYFNAVFTPPPKPLLENMKGLSEFDLNSKFEEYIQTLVGG